MDNLEITISDLDETVAITPRERQIIILRFGLDGNKPKTLEEVGHEFKITRERVRQIQAKCLEKIIKHRNDLHTRTEDIQQA